MPINTGRGPRKKIVRVSEKYNLDLQGLGREMAEMWTHPDDNQRYTLNELRDYFNRQILKKAMENADMEPVPGEVEYGYKYLFEDDTSHADEMDVRQRLEEHNVPVNEVIEDFINSPQTIHNYLRQVENVELDKNSDNRTQKEKSREHLKSLNRRYETIANDVIDSLIKNEELPPGDYTVNVECFVENKDTGTERNIADILSH